MLADVWAAQPDRQAWHLAEAVVDPDESVAVQLEGTAARILARGDAVGCVKALTRASELSPRSAERHRRLAAAAYIGADVAGDLGNASKMLAELRHGEVDLEGSLQAAVAASAFLLNADGDIATANRLLVRAIETRVGAYDNADPLLEEALNTLMMVCYYGGTADLWQPFHEIARDEADELLDEALRLADELGYGLLAWPAKLVQALIASARGDDRRTEELNAVVEWARPRGFGAVEWYAWQARGLAALGRGDFEDAYQQACMISPPGTLASHVPHALTVLMDLVQAAVRTGRDAEAAAHVAAMQEANLAGISSRLALVVGASAAVAAPDDTASELFEAALALPDIERWRFDLARVRLAYGERLRRRRAMVAARVQLNAALEIFECLRARPWMDHARAELRATGQTKPRAGDNVLDRLTVQEFEIVSLAASGLTNKQIAERLFLSPRTVGGHLHRAFPKLGVATRAALRDALASIPPEQLPR